MSPPLLTFLDPNKIEQVTAFSARLVVHTLCLDQIHSCNVSYSAVSENLTPAWPQYGVRTCCNLIGQSEDRYTHFVAGKAISIDVWDQFVLVT